MHMPTPQSQAVLISTESRELQSQLAGCVGKKVWKNLVIVVQPLFPSIITSGGPNSDLPRTLPQTDIHAQTGIPSLHFLLARHPGCYPLFRLTLHCLKNTNYQHL